MLGIVKTHENSLRESRTAYDDWTAKIKDVSLQIEETGKTINNLSSSTDHAGEIENLRQKYVALSEALQNSRTSFQEYNSSSQASKDATDANIQKILEESDALAQSVNRLKEQIDTEKTSAKFTRERNTLYTQTIRLLEQISQAQKNWSAAASGSQSENYKSLGRMAEQLRIIKSELEGASPNLTSLKGRLSQAGGAFKQVSAEIKEAGQNTATFSSKIKDSISQLARIFSISSIVYASIRYIKQMITTTIELDDAMTQLRIVTRAASSDISAYSDTIATSAKRIGASIADLIDSATTYARLGYSLDESSKLAEFTSMLQNVGDIDVSKAQDAITSIVKAFNIPVDKIESVMDKLVITGNNFPISVSQIAEGMTNASSALSAAGNTFEQSVALLTAANTTVQNASKSSTGLRTIAARLRNTKTELDELGEQMTWAQYNDMVSALTKHSVALTDMNGEFRSTYDILSDIARIWKELGSMEQAGLANKIAGVRQQAIFFSLIEQFQEASGAMEDMANSAGTLQESYDLYMESTTAHINQFKAAFQELSKNTFSTDFLNIFITFGTLLLEIVGKIMNVVNALGGLETAIYAVAIAVSFLKAEQILSGIESIGKALVSLGVKAISVAGTIATTFTGAFTAAQAAGSGALASLGSGFTALISSAGIAGVAIAVVVAALGGIILAVNKYKDHVKETVETSKALRTEHAKTLDTLDKNRKTVEDLAKTFETLSVGVDKNGRNVSLSAEEYAQYQDIVAQLADINPSLVRGYNQEKQAIIDKNSAIADTIQFLKDQRKLELTMQTSQENNWTIAKGIINELKQSQKEIRSESARVYDAFQEGLKASMRKNGAHVESILGADLEALKKQILSMYNLDSTSLASLSGYSASAWDAIFRQISNSSFNHGQIIRENMDDIVQYLDLSAQINLKNTLSYWDAAVAQAENKSKAFQAQLDANAMSLDSYEQLSDHARVFIHSWIDTIQIGARDSEKSINEMVNSVQAAVTRLADDPETQKKIEKLFDFNFSEMNADSIKNASAEAEKLIKKIQSALNLSDKDMAQIRANIGLDVNFTDENGGEIKTQGDLVEYVENKVRSIFGDDVDIGNLGMDDLRLLFSVDENDLAGFETLEEYLQSIAEQRDSVNETADALSDLSDTISDLKSAYDTLQTAQKEMDSGTGLSPETIKSIIAALKDTGKDYLDFLYEENGIIKLNTDLWKENANSRMSGDISHIKSEISALESRNAVIKETIGNYSKLGSANGVSTFSGKIQDLNAELAENTAKIQANQNMLALYENLYASVTGDVNTYQGALQNFSELSSFIDTITSKFQTLADIQTSLANGFALPLEKAMEFAAVYPEILDNAQYTADGQVLLNEAVANNFVGAKKAELDAAIDAKIADLESDKEVLESKVAFAQAQLDLAESAAKGEGEITEELAKYLIEAGDFVRQELIKAGIDEVHANEMAVAAMAGDFEEFDRIAKEVCANMDSNFGEAAYNAAVTLYRNMEAGKGSLSDLAAQAQNTAKAIAAMANGEVSGSTAIVHNNSNSGVKGPSAKIDTVKGKGNFEGSDYSYTPQKSSLDDFISQTKLDISKYKSQIATINGQIAALNALKNTKLQKFSSTKPSSGSGGSGSGNKGKSGSKPKSSGSSSSSGSDKNKKEKETKEVEEYIPVIDELREALERLRQVQTKRAELENIVDDPDRIHERVAALKEENAEFEYQADCLSQHLNALKLTSAIKNRGLNLDTYIDAYRKYIDSNGEAAESLNALGEGAENAGISVSDFMNILLDYDGFKSQYAVMKNLGQEELQNEIQQTSQALSENTKELLNNETVMRRYQAMLNGIDGSFNNEPIARLRVQIQLTKDLLSVYQSEKDALANLNQQRDHVIASSIESLRELGFVVEYNARTDELWIENLELLQELYSR